MQLSPEQKKYSFIALIIVGVVIAFLPAFYFYNKYQKTQQLLTNPTQASKEELKKLIDMVGKLIALPQNEEPSVATVSDKKKLQDNEFFNKAENGDKVFIFMKAKKAILYRPGINKIIDVAPVTVGSNSATLSPSGTPQPNGPKVVLYNGTKTTGLTNKAETELKTTITNIDVVAKENALKTYEKTIVVALSDDKASVAAQMAKLLSGTVEALPDGEVKPEADILVILGNDFAGN